MVEPKSSADLWEVPQRFNLTHWLLDRHLDRDGERVALEYRGTAWTYGALSRLVDRVGHGLRELGLQEEQRVFLLLPDSPEFVASYLGAIKVGAVAVPTNTTLPPHDYAFMLRESRPRVVILHADFWPRISPLLEKEDLPVVVCGRALPGLLSWEEWVAAQKEHLTPAATHRDDAAFWLWTSGSTGEPKAVVHLQRDWVYCCRGYAADVLKMSREDRILSSSKLFHAYGLGNSLAFPLQCGATSILFPERPTAVAMLREIEASRPSLFFSVPTLYAAMLQEAQQAPFDLSSLRLAVSAAEPLPAEIFRRWKERFQVEILDGIGSTEVLHIYLSSRPGQVKPGSTGQPVQGYQLRITDERGRQVGPGQIGDLWVKGASTSPFYWHRQELSRRRMQGEWFYSGDKYSLDEEGYYWYAGRSDDMFRVSGQWVSPIEVENTLVEHPAVLESAVVPFQDQHRLLRPQAFVVLKAGCQGTEELVKELQDFVKERLAPYKYPRRIRFVASLPKNAAGKIQRFRLKEGADQPPDPAP